MNRQGYEKKPSLPIISQLPGTFLEGVDGVEFVGENPSTGIAYSLMYVVWQEFEPASSWMQFRQPATNVTNRFFHFRICIPHTSHIKVFVAVYCHAVLNFGWTAALLSVSFCFPTPPSVTTGSFHPSPNERKLHYVKHAATRPTSIQQSRSVYWHLLRAARLLSRSE